MPNSELLEFLDRKKWTVEDQRRLVSLWNEHRDDVPPIGFNHTRTPCRLRNIVGSFKHFLKRKE